MCPTHLKSLHTLGSHLAFLPWASLPLPWQIIGEAEQLLPLHPAHQKSRYHRPGVTMATLMGRNDPASIQPQAHCKMKGSSVSAPDLLEGRVPCSLWCPRGFPHKTRDATFRMKSRKPWCQCRRFSVAFDLWSGHLFMCPGSALELLNKASWALQPWKEHGTSYMQMCMYLMHTARPVDEAELLCA